MVKYNKLNVVQSAKLSQFFKGSNIIDTLNKSSFGQAKAIIELLIEKNPEELAKFRLPKIIAVGNESTGKSSSMEKIVKCPILPRNNILWTKAPTRLILNSGEHKYTIKNTNPEYPKVITLDDKNDIFKHMVEIMTSISPKNSENITEYEIIIEFTEPNLPSLEFIDLPGLRTYPPDLAQITTNLCKKYLEIKEDIILCVVPATVTSLTSSQPLALINELGLCSNTILALTMADRLIMSEYGQDNLNNLLLDRILGKSNEMSYLKLGGCVAVINRNHTDTLNLEESDDMEAECFKKMLDNLPTEYEAYKKDIENNISGAKLLEKLNTFYIGYIQNNWKPIILHRINTEIIDIAKQIQDLGPETLTDETISKFINDFTDNELCLLIKPFSAYNSYDYQNFTTLEEAHLEKVTKEIKDKPENKDKEEIELPKCASSLFKYNKDLEMINTTNKIADQIRAFEISNYKKNDMISLFTSEFSKVHENYIHKFKESLLVFILTKINEFYHLYDNNNPTNYHKQLQIIKNQVETLLYQDYCSNSYNEYDYYLDTICKLCDAMIVSRLINIIKNSLNDIDRENDKCIYIEDSEYRMKRSKLADRIKILENYKEKVNLI